MTEQEWAASNDLEQMLTWIEPQASDRKLRLCAVACCARNDYFGSHSRSKQYRTGLRWAKRLADGKVSDLQRQGACRRARERADKEKAVELQDLFHALACALDAPVNVVQAASWARSAYAVTCFGNLDALEIEPDEGQVANKRHLERGEQADLVREIFGPLPFRPISIDPAWLTPTVTGIADRAYAHGLQSSQVRPVDAMGALADALEEAGCRDEELLEPCRASRCRVHGFWVLDLVLGRQ